MALRCSLLLPSFLLFLDFPPDSRSLTLPHPYNLPPHHSSSADAPYRTHMAKLVQHRLDILKTSEDVYELEDKLGAGQLEEQIEAMEREFKLLPFMLEHKPWLVPNRWHQPFMVYSDVK